MLNAEWILYCKQLFCVLSSKKLGFFIYLFDDLSYMYMSLVSLSKQKVFHMMRKTLLFCRLVVVILFIFIRQKDVTSHAHGSWMSKKPRYQVNVIIENL